MKSNIRTALKPSASILLVMINVRGKQRMKILQETRNWLGVCLAVLLAGCGGPPDEYVNTCIESHITLQPIFLPNGSGGMRMQMMPKTVCDEYETRRNPEYDKWLADNIDS